MTYLYALAFLYVWVIVGTWISIRLRWPMWLHVLVVLVPGVGEFFCMIWSAA